MCASSDRFKTAHEKQAVTAAKKQFFGNTAKVTGESICLGDAKPYTCHQLGKIGPDARKTIKNGKNRQFFQGLCTNPGITYTVGYVAKIYSEWPQVTFAALRFLTKAQNPAPAISCKMKNAKGALGALKQTTV